MHTSPPVNKIARFKSGRKPRVKYTSMGEISGGQVAGGLHIERTRPAVVGGGRRDGVGQVMT